MATSPDALNTIHDDDHQSNYTYANFGGFRVFGRWINESGSAIYEEQEARFSSSSGRYMGSTPNLSSNYEVSCKDWRSTDNKTLVRWQGYNSSFAPGYTTQDADSGAPQVGQIILQHPTPPGYAHPQLGVFRQSNPFTVENSHGTSIWVNKKLIVAPQRVLSACTFKDESNALWVKAILFSEAENEGNVDVVFSAWARKVKIADEEAGPIESGPEAEVYLHSGFKTLVMFSTDFAWVFRSNFNGSATRASFFTGTNAPPMDTELPRDAWGYFDWPSVGVRPTFVSVDLVPIVGSRTQSEDGLTSHDVAVLDLGYRGETLGVFWVEVDYVRTIGFGAGHSAYETIRLTNVFKVYDQGGTRELERFVSSSFANRNSESVPFSGGFFEVSYTIDGGQPQFDFLIPAGSSIQDDLYVFFRGTQLPMNYSGSGARRIETNNTIVDATGDGTQAGAIPRDFIVWFKGQRGTVPVEASYFKPPVNFVDSNGVASTLDGLGGFTRTYSRSVTGTHQGSDSSPITVGISIPPSYRDIQMQYYTNSSVGRYAAAFSSSMGFSFATSVPSNTVFCSFLGYVPGGAPSDFYNGMAFAFRYDFSGLTRVNYPSSLRYHKLHTTYR